jgi:hypothetical protein
MRRSIWHVMMIEVVLKIVLAGRLQLPRQQASGHP